jgi:hypothetical protein
MSIVNLAEAGNGFPWHFDTNNYTVTLAIQNAESGGEFEYSPGLRSATDENYAGVERVLDGDPSLIRTLVLEPGSTDIPGAVFAAPGHAAAGYTAPLRGDLQFCGAPRYGGKP